MAIDKLIVWIKIWAVLTIFTAGVTVARLLVDLGVL